MNKDKLPTYKMVQEDIKSKYNITIKTCWIAHVKEMYGLIKKNLNRKYPCPEQHIEKIAKSLGLI